MKEKDVTVQGVSMPAAFRKIEKDILNFPVREQDVWTCGIPKSGTTWMHEMVWLIQNNLDYEAAKESIHTRSPFLEASIMVDHIRRDVQYLDDSVALVKKKYDEKTQICLRTHLPWRLLPKSIQDGSKNPKIVYIARNPKDVVTSGYHFLRLLYEETISFEKYCKEYIGGKRCFTPYWDHVFGYWKRRNLPNVLFLRYEDMKEDLYAVIKKVAFFLEKSMTDDQVANLAAHLSFDRMKKNPAVNHEGFVQIAREVKGLKRTKDGHFMRSGEAGSYRKDMSPELIEIFDQWIEKNTGGTDYVI